MTTPTYRKIQVHQLSTDFGEATRIITLPIPTDLPADACWINVYHVGINASDINFTAGRYNPTLKPPFDAGFEASYKRCSEVMMAGYWGD